MEYWALVRDGLVVSIVVLDPDAANGAPEAWLQANVSSDGEWLLTTNDCRWGQRIDVATGEFLGGEHFRFSAAAPGYSWHSDIGTDGAFVEPQPFPSWHLDEEVCRWRAPILCPDDRATWNEDTQEWELPALDAVGNGED